ncbi:hypothetical protein JCM5350_004515 [Sporobolomyces pararoseus]
MRSSVIETLHVRNVIENPRAPNPWEDGSVKFKTASKLCELSVWGHQGGADLWSTYLRQEYLPQLRRLGFSDVTSVNLEHVDRERYLSDNSDDSWAGQGRSEVEQLEQQLFFDERMPLAQLEVVVSPIASDFQKLPNFPYDNSLALISDFNHPSKEHSSYRKNFALVYSENTKPEELQRLFNIVYRATPPSNAEGQNVRLFLDGRPWRISPHDYDRMVSQVKGCQVHDSRQEKKKTNSDSLILPSFVQHLRDTSKSSEPAMPARQLPPELLTDIFSNLTSSPSTLHRSLFVSRTFCKLVKFVLYRNVVITCNEDWGLLRRAKEVDEQLVKKVSILGNGPYHAREWNRGSETYWEAVQGSLGECVHDLLAEKFLEISDPDSTLAPKVFKIASKLKELSIWRHQGGGDFWRSYLDNITNLPNLRHLGFAEVTSYHDNEDDSYSVSEYLADDEYLGIYELPVLLPNSPLLTKFEVLIAEPPSRLEDFQNYPFDIFLALIRPPEVNQPFTLSSLIRNCRMMGLWDGATESDAIAVQNLRPKIKTSDNVLHFFPRVVRGGPILQTRTFSLKSSPQI